MPDPSVLETLAAPGASAAGGLEAREVASFKAG